MAGKVGGAIPLSMGAGAVDDFGEMIDGLGELEIIPEFLKMTDHLAIELEVIPIDAPALHFKNAKEIELETITQVRTTPLFFLFCISS